jgi:hypothetical protein
MTHDDASDRDGAEWGLLAILIFTGLTAIIGGLLLIARPDGSLLHASESALAATPFANWPIPGIFPAIFVGLGGLGTADWLLIRGWGARGVAYLFAIGLLLFEIVEWATIGFQPLEGLFGLVAVGLMLLTSTSNTIGRRPGTSWPPAGRTSGEAART